MIAATKAVQFDAELSDHGSTLESVMDPVTGALIAKFGAGLTGKAAGGGVLKLGTSWWSSWRRKLARVVDARSPYPVPKRQLKKVLRREDFIALAAPEDEAGAGRLTDVVAAALAPTRSWRGLPAATVRERAEAVSQLVRDELLATVDPSGASEALDRREESRHREVLAVVGRQELRRRLAQLKLPPYIAEEVEAAHDHCPRLVELAEAMAGASDPAQRLVSWLLDPPQWFADAPSTAWEVLGHALASYGRHAEAAEAYLQAAPGAPDPAVLRAQAAHCLAVGHIGTVDEHEDGGSALDARVPDLLARNNAALGQWVKAALNGDWSAARVAAFNLPTDSWRKTDTRATILAQTLLLAEDYLGAERLLVDVLTKTESATPFLLLSLLRCLQASRGQAPSRGAALLEATNLAQEARRRRRAWGGDSADATIRAAEPAWLNRDIDLVRQLVEPPPEGDATSAEADDPRVRAFRGRLAALHDRPELARRLVADLDHFTRLHIEALLVETPVPTEPVPEEVAATWLALWNAATTDPERELAARGLALVGVEVDLTDLQGRLPEAVKEVDELADIARPRRDESVRAWQQRLNEARWRRVDAANEYGELLASAGNDRAAAKALSEAADHFDDQSLRMRAAALLYAADDLEGALATAEAVLSKTRSEWFGRRRAYELALNAAATLGSWSRVIAYARELLVIEDTAQVRWMLAHALAAQDDFNAAWAVLNASDQVLAPLPGKANQSQTRLRMDLARRCGSRQQLIDCALDALHRYPDDEAFFASVMGSVFTGSSQVSGGANGATDFDQIVATAAAGDAVLVEGEAELAEMLAQFPQRFPNSDYFRTIVFDDPEDPEEIVAKLTPFVADRSVALEEAWDKVRTYEWPFGVFALAASRSYAEVRILAAGQGVLLRIAAPELDRSQRDAAASAPHLPTLIDATALHVLSLLNPEARGACLEARSVLQVTSATLIDLRAARDSLAIHGSMTLGYDSQAERLVATEIAPRVAEAFAQTAIHLLDLVKAAETIPGRRLDDTRRAQAEPWLGLVETCRAEGKALWSDDPVLRVIARSEGVLSFGTVALLDHLRSSGQLDEQEHGSALMDLTEAGAVDLPIDAARLRAVATRQEWRPDAVGIFLTRGVSWSSDTATCVHLVGEGFERQAGQPDMLAGWMRAAAEGICSATPASAQVHALLANVLALGVCLRAMKPIGVLALVEACRTVTKRHDVADVWPGAIRIVRDALLEQHTEAECRLILTSLVADLTPDDRSEAVRALLERPRSGGRTR